MNRLNHLEALGLNFSIGLPKPIGYKYFYINENWEYVEITKKQYEEWSISGWLYNRFPSRSKLKI